MLDTHARKWVQPTINKIAHGCIKIGLTPTRLTIIALVLGVLAAYLNHLVYPIVAVIILWISGLIDALDGTVARITDTKSDIGAFLDITFDRVVEVSILYSLFSRNPDLLMMLFVLLTTFLLSMTVFLTVGSLSKNKSEKAFYYQAGITERTETFVFFTLMILFIEHAIIIGYVFAFLVIITILIRFYEGVKYLK